MRTSVEIFSSNLRRMLEENRKTQRDLARYLKVTEATVSRWVNAESMPRHAMLDKVAAFFICSPDELTTDRQRTVTLLPQDVIADELHQNPKLFQLFIVAMKATDEQIDACIKLLKK